MANLSIGEITRESKEYRIEVLVNKVFKHNNLSNTFTTSNGLFNASGLIVGNETFKGKQTAAKIKNIIKLVYYLKAAPRNERVLKIIGKYSGERKESQVSITELSKTEEFGGQPAGGKRENKGIKFEKDLEAQLHNVLNGKKVTGTYAEQSKKIIDKCSTAMKSPVESIIPMGALNQKRPIALQGTQLYIEPNDHKKHGEKLTDITLKHANGKLSYLSLKFSSTLTFMNSGVGTIFPAAEIKKGKITNPIGKAILETFSLDEQTFCDVFNYYGKRKFESVSAKINKTKLRNFLQTCIGSNYWMIHGMPGNKIYFWEMSSEKNSAFATVNGNVEIQYGGSKGRGKRIDIVFSNQYFDFKVNIRNKQSGLYPSHIMCDYTSKSATGKELL